MSDLAQQSNRLEPAETFLDPFPLPLAKNERIATGHYFYHPITCPSFLVLTFAMKMIAARSY